MTPCAPGARSSSQPRRDPERDTALGEPEAALAHRLGPHAGVALLLGCCGAMIAAMPAAGETSASPFGAPPTAMQAAPGPKPSTPDLAFGAFQRGYFATALQEATHRLNDNPDDGAAMALIGTIYAQGLAVKKDPGEAAHWYRLASEHGNREGTFAYAMALLNGDGVAQDKTAAKAAFESAAAQGHAGALYNLGVMALEGDGVTHDYATASSYFERAAAAGDLDALFALGEMYKAGEGVERDLAKAASFYKAAADQKHPAAQLEYGIMVFNGEGVPKDEAAAAGYFLRSADEGNPVAANRLARLYAAGRGVDKNNVEAARWHLLARAKGLSDPWLDTVLTGLSASERAKVETDLRKTLGR